MCFEICAVEIKEWRQNLHLLRLRSQNNLKRYNQPVMKKHENEVRRKMVVVRLNQSEYDQLQKLQRQTTEKTISNYLHKLALNKQVIVKYRNVMADDFLIINQNVITNTVLIYINHVYQFYRKE
jgi:hypothetical protein